MRLLLDLAETGTAAFALVGALAAAVLSSPGQTSPAPAVLIVSSSRVPAYAEAVEGLRRSLDDHPVTVVSLDEAAGSVKPTERIAAWKHGVIVAVGSAAVDAVRAASPSAPVVATMVLAGAAASPAAGNGITATIGLDIPPGAILGHLKRCSPQRKRIALVRGRATSETALATILEQGRKYGFDLHVLTPSGPGELLDTIGTLRGRFDFLWCLPDSTLYQGPTVTALILTAIRNHLAVIGFSEGMVRAGTLVGFYPDYRDIGQQTGELVRRRIEGQALPSFEPPRQLKAALNERVLRVLGMDFNVSCIPGLLIVK